MSAAGSLEISAASLTVKSCLFSALVMAFSVLVGIPLPFSLLTFASVREPCFCLLELPVDVSFVFASYLLLHSGGGNNPPALFAGAGNICRSLWPAMQRVVVLPDV